MTHPLIKKAAALLPGNAPAAQKKLLEVLTRDIPEEDMAFFSPELLAEMTLAHWTMAREREKGEPKIQIYCPLTKDKSPRKTVIDVVSDDAAFLVDSLVAEINKNRLLIDLLIHPIIYTAYDRNGRMTDAANQPGDGLIRQSHIHIQIKETMAEETLAELETGLYTAMEDVYTANRDWRAMLAKLKEARDELAGASTKRPLKEIEQYCAFLDYLYNNNFTLLGYREYRFTEKDGTIKSRTVKGAGLGLLADDVRPAYLSETKEGLPRNLQDLRRRLNPVSVSKTNRLSTVHRRVPMDAIAIKIYDSQGIVTGEKLFIGLFTSVTYSRSVSDVPYLREKVEDAIHMSGFIQGSHDRKALRHILEKYPRDELFQMETEEIYKTALNILRLQERQRIALFMRHDPFGRYISCLVYIPRERFGTKLRMKMQHILEQKLSGVCATFYTTLDDSVFARVMFIINISQKNPPSYDPAEIETLLQEAGQSWQELLTAALAENIRDEPSLTNLTLKYAEAFPVGYITRYKAKQAVFDIEKIEQAQTALRLTLDLYRPEELDLKQMRLKVYNPGEPITLSDVMPILDNMGLRAIAELPYEITPAESEQAVWIHDFLLETPEVQDFIDIKKVKANFERAFTRIWHNEVENDGLNRLVLSANMNWHETTILRAYVRYMRQIRFPFSREYVENALTAHPKISRMLVDLFKAFHNPANGKNADSLAAGCAVGIDHELEKVESLAQDRILRTITGLIESTVRTNYFQRREDGEAKPYLSLKLSSKTIADLPEPKPFMEIFVYSPRVEAIHLRGDKIARGGLRWSDRHEDYRTEVLGLMKAQMVKNAVIVPMGAKGGFVVKTPSKSREEFHKEGVECYKIFIRGLLDITDNLKGEQIIPPQDVVRRDEDDPYLVVAADKGTATFSDIANGLSQDYEFWMDDAFASGGSAGYDHKKMGITARGAWESVKLHFRQLNHNTQENPFEVIGIGDMSGDVFGNGMLLSDKIRLAGAFNHLHIFCDPDPDPTASFRERRRLFDAVKGWDQYNEKILSNGGRIYSRQDKILTLTPEIRQRFDIAKEKVTPIELIRAMLKARTDLLWFGGIGTYIKSSKETHADVGDKANDALRIDAGELRAKVIGEGANLALTQRGRIEAAEKGVRLNTDFLDNSGGVDSSDHEVNIKILLKDVMDQKSHDMDLKARNKLLEKMTEEVAAHVLRNNYQQALAISLAEHQARDKLQIQAEFIRDMERYQGLNRKIEGLPDDDTIEMRLRNGKGLTRPELCILLSYAKISFTQNLLDSDIPDNQDMQDWMMDYFPDVLQKKYASEIARHKLKREIVATAMANSLINRMGPTFIKSRMIKTGASAAEIAKAYIIVRDAFGLRKLWDAIEGLDNKALAEVQLRAMHEIAQLAEHAVTWFLIRLGRDVEIGPDVKNFSKGVESLRDNLANLVTDNLRETIEQRQSSWERDGLPAELARQIALMPVLSSACDIIRISLERKTDLTETARTYFELGAHFHMDWLRQQARFMPSDDHWHAEAKYGLVDQLFSCQAGMTVRILKDTGGKAGKNGSLLEQWLVQHSHQRLQLEPLFTELRRTGTIDLPMLVIAEQKLRNFYGG